MSKKVINCRYCKWSWDYSDGGDDKFKCHLCGNDNSRFYDIIEESDKPKKKLFIPRDLDDRYVKLVDDMLINNNGIGTYLSNRDIYEDLKDDLDPIIMKLPKDKLKIFIKMNPFWVDSIDRVKFLIDGLTYEENKEISENHIGMTFSDNFFTSKAMSYYEDKFKKPIDRYKNTDVYVFVGGYDFIGDDETGYKKVFNIENLYRISTNNWKDISDFKKRGNIGFMKIRAKQNNKELYMITTKRGLLRKYEGVSGLIPDYVLATIDELKVKV